METASPGQQRGSYAKEGHNDSKTYKEKSVEETQKTTMRSEKSASVRSKKSTKSIGSKQRSQRLSQTQTCTNEFYVVGNLDTININYNVDAATGNVTTRAPLQTE